MKITAYTPDNLAEALSNGFTTTAVVKSKYHFLYFTGYLGPQGLQAASILVEEEYVSKDFLHDYASYYAFCFEPYPKFCKRVHLFNSVITPNSLRSAVLEKTEAASAFWDGYLGFIVVKPIPGKIIGFTVLKTYEGSNNFDARYFWGTRNYQVHLYGRAITVNSLAFQEQDSVLAACATTAIWSMLNKASIDHHTILKSPSQITKDADNVSPDGSRLFPNKGLSVLQICQAIVNSGLVTEVKQPNYEKVDADGNVEGYFVTHAYTRKILNAYAAIGIPLILVIRVPNGGAHGLHAITVSGFKQTAPKAIAPKPETGFLSDNIETIYAHDDQWGPFAKATFRGTIDLITPWTNFDPNKLPTHVTNIIVPVYPKIRISYEDIEAIILGLDTVLSLFFDQKNLHDLVWDIKIDYSESHKTRIRNSALDNDSKIQKLVKSSPKYLWIAKCYIATYVLIDFTFDATDVNNGMIGEDVVCYLPQAGKQELLQFLQVNESILKDVFPHPDSINYYRFLIRALF